MFVPFRFQPQARNSGGVSVEAEPTFRRYERAAQGRAQNASAEARRVVPRKSLRKSMLVVTTFDPSV